MIDKIVLGTAQLGMDYGISNEFGYSKENSLKILETASKNNILSIDTSPNYGYALDVIGEFHKSSGYKFKIFSKFISSSEDIGKGIYEQLEVLDVEALEVLYFHRSDDLIKNPGLISILLELKNKSLIKKIGVSCYENEEVEAVLRYEVDCIQFPYNLLDNMAQRGQVISDLSEKGIESHVRSVFLQGLLLTSPKDLPSGLDSFADLLVAINNIANSLNISGRELALRYVLSNDNLNKIILGVDSPFQLKENLNIVAKGALPKEALKLLDGLAVKERILLNPSRWPVNK